MPYVVSPYIPFPNIYWWLKVVDAGSVLFDGAEHFQKMSYRNRYYISGSNGLIQLSIPLANGRDQRAAMRNIRIAYNENWQVQHWRTLVSVYSRTPYFHYYEPGLKKIFDTNFTLLTEFNLASVNWLKEQLRTNVDIQFSEVYQEWYPDDIPDLRKDFKPGLEKGSATALPPYYQIFSDRTGFLPNLSMVDLLFSEGPHSLQWLKDNRNLVGAWERR
jgi:hypothetical protein